MQENDLQSTTAETGSILLMPDWQEPDDEWMANQIRFMEQDLAKYKADLPGLLARNAASPTQYTTDWIKWMTEAIAQLEEEIQTIRTGDLTYEAAKEFIGE